MHSNDIWRLSNHHTMELDLKNSDNWAANISIWRPNSYRVYPYNICLFLQNFTQDYRRSAGKLFFKICISKGAPSWEMFYFDIIQKNIHIHILCWSAHKWKITTWLCILVYFPFLRSSHSDLLKHGVQSKVQVELSGNLW